MKWVVKMMLTPAERSCPISSQVACLACGSMPAVGSSRNTSSGRPMTAAASDSRCCCPPDSRLYGVRATAVRPTRSSSAGTATGLVWNRLSRFR